jgi:hypothetical protein
MPPKMVVDIEWGTVVDVYLRKFEGDDIVQHQKYKYLLVQKRFTSAMAIAGTNFVDVNQIRHFLHGSSGAAGPSVLEFDRFQPDFTDEDYGVTVAMSENGTRLAVASPGTFISAHDVGQVQIYEIGVGQKLGRKSLALTGTTILGRLSLYPMTERSLLLEH